MHAPTLPIAGLEQVYHRLAVAIDEASPGKSEMFLVKLTLLCAHSLADAALFESHVDTALKDL